MIADIHTVSECNWLPTLTINKAGRNNRTATFEISFEESTPISWNWDAMTPTNIVSKTAMDACRAPRKGISNSWVAWPIVKGTKLVDKTSEGPGCVIERRTNAERVARVEQKGYYSGDRDKT